VARGGGRDECGDITDDEADSPGEDGDDVLSESDDDAPLVRKFFFFDSQPESPHTKRVLEVYQYQ
jgi:hypothetical protein